MIIGLSLRPGKEGSLAYSVSRGSRVVLGIFFLLQSYVLFSGVLFYGESTIFLKENWLALFLEACALFALLYEERWVLDKNRDSLENRFGLLIAYKKRKIPLSALKEFRFECFVKGRPEQVVPADDSVPLHSRLSGRIVRIAAVDSAGSTYVLETANARRAEDLRRAGMKMAAYCGIPFRETGLSGSLKD